jgi:hypothetical protein
VVGKNSRKIETRKILKKKGYEKQNYSPPLLATVSQIKKEKRGEKKGNDWRSESVSRLYTLA